jgi:hypothetical protein
MQEQASSMVEIHPEQFELMSLSAALRPLQLTAGQKVGIEPYETIPSLLDDAVNPQDILERFYNGGAFRAIRSILMGSYGHARKDETGRYQTMHYTFIERVLPGRTPTSTSDSFQTPVIGYEKRSYAVRYYPGTEQVHGSSQFLDRMHDPTDPVYDIAISQESLSCNYPLYESQHPEATQLIVARAAIKHFTFDVALDTAYGLSGA